MEENNIVTGTESPVGAESSGGDDFLNGLFGEEEFPESGEESSGNEGEEPENEEPEDAPGEVPEEPEAKTPETVDIVEHGKTFSIPKEALEGFAAAVGRESADLIDIYQKGCNYDRLKARNEGLSKKAEVIDRIAEMRGISTEELVRETLSFVDEIPLKKMMNEIREKNPGLDEKTAEELARYRLEKNAPKAPEKKAETDDSERTAAKLREIEMFRAKHSGEGIENLPNEVIDAWEKTGIDLEEAFGNFMAKEKARELEKKNAELERENRLLKEKRYASEHTAGSASSAAGKTERDPFLEGLGL